MGPTNKQDHLHFECIKVKITTLSQKDVTLKIDKDGLKSLQKI